MADKKPVDQYGRPKTRYDESPGSAGPYFSSLAEARKNPIYNLDKLGIRRLYDELNAGGKPTYLENSLSKDEKASRGKMNADAKEKGKYMKAALAKAAQKAKPAKPTSPPPRSKNPVPKPPVTKAPPKPGKPDYNTKDVPMPNKSKTKKKYYGGA